MKKTPSLPILACLTLILSCAPGTSAVITVLDSRLLQKYQEAKLRYLTGALEAAEKGFREVAAERGDFFQARFMLAKTLFSLNRPDEAETLFRELAARYPQYHEAEIWLVRAALARGKTDEAAARLETLLAFDSADPRLLSLYAQSRAAKEDAAGALEYYRLSVQFEEECALNHFEIARYYHQFGMREKALLELDRCLFLLAPGSGMQTAVEELKTTILKNDGERK